jgi:hypothetical protein
MWIVHFLTFHQPHDFLSSGSVGCPSEGTGLSNIFRKRIIQALNIFGSNSCFGISNWKEQTQTKRIFKGYINLNKGSSVLTGGIKEEEKRSSGPRLQVLTWKYTLSGKQLYSEKMHCPSGICKKKKKKKISKSLTW